MMHQNSDEQIETESKDTTPDKFGKSTDSGCLIPEESYSDKASKEADEHTAEEHQCPHLMSPTDYSTEVGQQLLRCHLVGCCCPDTLRSLKGPKGKKVRQRAQRLQFLDLVRIPGNYWKLTIMEPANNAKGKDKISSTEFGEDDIFPDDWTAPFWRYATT